jgi:hypothetical protein
MINNLIKSMKKYLTWTIGILAVTMLTVLSQAVGWLPLSNSAFITLTMVLLVITIKAPRQIFWLFLAILPLENIIFSSTNSPVAIRPFQLVGIVLVIALIFLTVFENKLKNKKKSGKNSEIDFRLLKFALPSLALFKMEKPPIRDGSIYLNPVDRIVVAFGIAGLMGAQFSPIPGTSLKLSAVLLSFVGFYWLARNFTRTNIHLLENAWFFSVGISAVLIFGFYQKIAEKFGWNSFQVMEHRINSTFTEPNWLGMYLVFSLAILLAAKYLLSNLQDKNFTNNQIEKIISMRIGKYTLIAISQIKINLFLFFLTVILITTVSRSAWLGAVAVVVMYGLINWLKDGFKNAFKKISLLVGIAILAIVFLKSFGLSEFHLANRASSSISGWQKITISCQQNATKKQIKVGEKIASIQELANYGCRHIDLEEVEFEKKNGGVIKEIYRPDPSVNIRKDIYKKSWPVIKKNWLFGQGLGSSSVFLGEDNLGHRLNTSNIFLEVLISTGFIGLMLFGIIIVTPFVVGLKLLQLKSGKYADRTKEVIAVFFLLTFFAILVPNLFNAGIFLAFFWAWLAVINSYLSINEYGNKNK